MTVVFLAHEKHGTNAYATALEIVQQRFEEGWYDNWDDGDHGHQWEDRARKIVEAGNNLHPKAESVAERFLGYRNDHEYEYVERQEI